MTQPLKMIRSMDGARYVHLPDLQYRAFAIFQLAACQAFDRDVLSQTESSGERSSQWPCVRHVTSDMYLAALSVLHSLSRS